MVITKCLELLQDLSRDSGMYRVLIELTTLFGLWRLEKHVSTLFAGIIIINY